MVANVRISPGSVGSGIVLLGATRALTVNDDTDAEVQQLFRQYEWDDLAADIASYGDSDVASYLQGLSGSATGYYLERTATGMQWSQVTAGSSGLTTYETYSSGTSYAKWSIILHNSNLYIQSNSTATSTEPGTTAGTNAGWLRIDGGGGTALTLAAVVTALGAPAVANANQSQLLTRKSDNSGFEYIDPASLDPYTAGEIVTKLGMATMANANQGFIVIRKGDNTGFTYQNPNDLDPYTVAEVVTKLGMATMANANRQHLVRRKNDDTGFEYVDPASLDPYTTAEVRTKAQLPTPSAANNSQILEWHQATSMYRFTAKSSGGTGTVTSNTPQTIVYDDTAIADGDTGQVIDVTGGSFASGDIVTERDTTSNEWVTVKAGSYLVTVRATPDATSNERFSPALALNNTTTLDITATNPLSLLTGMYYRGNDGQRMGIYVGELYLTADTNISLFAYQYEEDTTPQQTGEAGTLDSITLKFTPIGGVKGDNGALWYTGNAAPTATTYNDGDMWLVQSNDSANGDVYRFASSAWTKTGSIKGADGTDGTSPTYADATTADTTSGAGGSATDAARSDHTHAKSSLYAEATHGTHVLAGGSANQHLAKNAANDGYTWVNPPTGASYASATNADTSSGAAGSAATGARSDHAHAKSSIYAEAAHGTHVVTGGTAGQVLAKNSANDGYVWVNQSSGGTTLPAGASANQLLARNSADDGYTWVNPPTGVPAGGTANQHLAKNSANDGLTWVSPPTPLTLDDSKAADTESGTNGTATTAARSDHAHAKSSLYAEAAHGTHLPAGASASQHLARNSANDGYEWVDPPTPLTLANSKAADTTSGTDGSATTAARSDHAHALSSIYAAASHTHTAELPSGAAAGQHLARNSADDGYEWVNPPIAIPAGGNANQLLAKNAANDGYVWVSSSSNVAGLSIVHVDTVTLSTSAADTGIAMSSLADIVWLEVEYDRDSSGTDIHFITLLRKADVGADSSNAYRLQLQGAGSAYIDVYQESSNLYFGDLATAFTNGSIDVYNVASTNIPTFDPTQVNLYEGVKAILKKSGIVEITASDSNHTLTIGGTSVTFADSKAADTESGTNGTATTAARSDHAHAKSSLYAEASHGTHVVAGGSAGQHLAKNAANDGYTWVSPPTPLTLADSKSADTESGTNGSATTAARSDHAHAKSSLYAEAAHGTHVLTGGTANQHLAKNSANDGYAWVDAPTPLTLANSKAADTESGTNGSATTAARSDHAHAKSTLYAEASHTHTAELPAGATANQILARNNANDAYEWVNPPTGLPAGGSANQHLAKNAANDGYVWIDPPTGGTGSDHSNEISALDERIKFVRGQTTALNLTQASTWSAFNSDLALVSWAVGVAANNYESLTWAKATVNPAAGANRSLYVDLQDGLDISQFRFMIGNLNLYQSTFTRVTLTNTPDNRTIYRSNLVSGNIDYILQKRDNTFTYAVPSDSVGTAQLSTTGTASATTVLHGDMQWKAVSGGTTLPAGASANQHLARNSADDGYTWVDPPTPLTLANSKAADTESGTNGSATTAARSDHAHAKSSLYAEATHGTHVPAGGNANQHLAKNSANDGYTWVSPPTPLTLADSKAADTTSGTDGSATTAARSDHAHALSSIYASASHTHTAELPSGAAANQHLARNAADDGYEWVNPPIGVPAGGNANQLLAKNAANDGYEWVSSSSNVAGLSTVHIDTVTLSTSDVDTGIAMSALADVLWLEIEYDRDSNGTDIHFITLIRKTDVGADSSNPYKLQLQGAGSAYIDVYQESSNLYFGDLNTAYTNGSIDVYNVASTNIPTFDPSQTNLYEGVKAILQKSGIVEITPNDSSHTLTIGGTVITFADSKAADTESGTDGTATTAARSDHAHAKSSLYAEATHGTHVVTGGTAGQHLAKNAANDGYVWVDPPTGGTGSDHSGEIAALDDRIKFIRGQTTALNLTQSSTWNSFNSDLALVSWSVDDTETDYDNLTWVKTTIQPSVGNGRRLYVDLQDGLDISQLRFLITGTQLFESRWVKITLTNSPDNRTIYRSGPVSGLSVYQLQRRARTFTYAVPDNSVGTAQLNTTGTASATTVLHGDMEWKTISSGGTTLPAGASANQHLARNSADDGYEWVDPPTPLTLAGAKAADTTSGTDGTATTAARSDHAHSLSGIYATSSHGTHVTYSSTSPLSDTESGDAGGNASAARSNHRHAKSSLYAEATHTHTAELPAGGTANQHLAKNTANDGLVWVDPPTGGGTVASIPPEAYAYDDTAVADGSTGTIIDVTGGSFTAGSLVTARDTTSNEWVTVKAGSYLVTVRATPDATSSERFSPAIALHNATTFNITTTDPISLLSANYYRGDDGQRRSVYVGELYLSADTNLSLFAYQYETDTTPQQTGEAGTLDDISLKFTPVGGVKGDKGDKGDVGSGSTVVVQDEGTQVGSAAVGTLNFTGTGVTATESGGVAIITIPTPAQRALASATAVDTTGGNGGSASTAARSDHRHSKSGLYADSGHTHTLLMPSGGSANQHLAKNNANDGFVWVDPPIGGGTGGTTRKYLGSMPIYYRTDEGIVNKPSGGSVGDIPSTLNMPSGWSSFAERGDDDELDFDTLSAAGNEDPRGLWSDGTTMWVVDTTDSKIYAYNLSTKARDTSKDFNTLSAAGNDLPIGLWSDGTTMWVTDSTDDKIYAYNLSTKARDAAKDFNTLSAAGNENPGGLWSDGTTMWVTDHFDDKIYAYNISTKARDASKDFNTLSAAGNNSPTGLWSDGTTMWISDSTTFTIYAYNLNTKARDTAKDFDTLYAAGNTDPTGLWSDGTTMWVADSNDNKIYAYDIYSKSHGRRKEDFNTLSAAGNENPRGLWSDGTTIWVADFTDDKIYAYNLSTKARDAAKDFNTLSAAGNADPTGLWSDGTTMWVADFTDNKIYAYNISTKARDASKDFNTLSAAGNADPRGLWSDGTTMWVADFTDNKIYAYNLSTKARDTSKDFNTLSAAGNADPTGLWSDGTTIWVADFTDDKIYAYNLSTKARDAAKDFNTLSAAGNADPTGLWSDGTTMWVADHFDNNINVIDKIYSYSMPYRNTMLSEATWYDDGTIEYSEPRSHVPSVSSAGAAQKQVVGRVNLYRRSDDDTVDYPHGAQVLDSSGGALATGTFYSPTGWSTAFDEAVDRDKDFDTLSAAGNNDPTGLWSDGTTMWVTDTVDDKIYAYNLVTKARDASKDFNTLSAAGNNDPTGLWSDGTTMWVTDTVDDKIYAYNLVTKARDASKDFNTLSAAGNTDPTGLWSDGTTMWVVDSRDSKIYAYNLSTKARDASKDFDTLSAADGSETPEGLWSDGTTMWVVNMDNLAVDIHAYNLSTKARDASKDFDTLLTAGNANPTGLWSDGTTMWVVDARDDKIYAYSMANKQYLGHLNSTSWDLHSDNNNPTGVWSNGTTMWVADNIDDKIYAYNLNTKARDSSKDFNTLSAAGNGSPTGLWSDGTTMWVVDDDDSKAYAYNLSTKARDTSKDFDTLSAAGNNQPTGMWSDGTTIWVSDNVDDKIYAYNLSTKAQDTSKDFNTLDAAGNNTPFNIWSDGTTMWVIDVSDSKIYAYNLNTKARDVSKDVNRLAVSGNATPLGLWSDSTTMWVSDTDRKIYGHPVPYRNTFISEATWYDDGSIEYSEPKKVTQGDHEVYYVLPQTSSERASTTTNQAGYISWSHNILPDVPLSRVEGAKDGDIVVFHRYTTGTRRVTTYHYMQLDGRLVNIGTNEKALSASTVVDSDTFYGSEPIEDPVLEFDSLVDADNTLPHRFNELASGSVGPHQLNVLTDIRFPLPEVHSDDYLLVKHDLDIPDNFEDPVFELQTYNSAVISNQADIVVGKPGYTAININGLPGNTTFKLVFIAGKTDNVNARIRGTIDRITLIRGSSSETPIVAEIAEQYLEKRLGTKGIHDEYTQADIESNVTRLPAVALPERIQSLDSQLVESWDDGSPQIPGVTANFVANVMLEDDDENIYVWQNVQRKLYKYNISTKTWDSGSSAVSGSDDLSVYGMGKKSNGDIVILSQSERKVYTYRPSTDTWDSGGPAASSAATGFWSCIVDEYDDILALDATGRRVYTYDTTANTWNNGASQAPSAATSMNHSFLKDGNVLAIDGATRKIYTYDRNSNTWDDGGAAAPAEATRMWDGAVKADGTIITYSRDTDKFYAYKDGTWSEYHIQRPHSEAGTIITIITRNGDFLLIGKTATSGSEARLLYTYAARVPVPEVTPYVGDVPNLKSHWLGDTNTITVTAPTSSTLIADPVPDIVDVAAGDVLVFEIEATIPTALEDGLSAAPKRSSGSAIADWQTLDNGHHFYFYETSASVPSDQTLDFDTYATATGTAQVQILGCWHLDSSIDITSQEIVDLYLQILEERVTDVEERLTFRGEWDQHARYWQGQVVIFGSNDPRLYIRLTTMAAVPTTSQPGPRSDTDHWKPISDYFGEFVAGRYYPEGITVTDSGGVYICIANAANSDGAPSTNTTNWARIDNQSGTNAIHTWARSGNTDVIPVTKLGSGTTGAERMLFGDGAWKAQPRYRGTYSGSATYIQGDTLFYASKYYLKHTAGGVTGGYNPDQNSAFKEVFGAATSVSLAQISSEENGNYTLTVGSNSVKVYRDGMAWREQWQSSLQYQPGAVVVYGDSLWARQFPGAFGSTTNTDQSQNPAPGSSSDTGYWQRIGSAVRNAMAWEGSWSSGSYPSGSVVLRNNVLYRNTLNGSNNNTPPGTGWESLFTQNVQADWNITSTTNPGFIKNKPSLSGYTNVQSDWNESDTTSDAYIENKPALAPSNAEQNVKSNWAATSGDAEILNKPYVPNLNNKTGVWIIRSTAANANQTWFAQGAQQYEQDYVHHDDIPAGTIVQIRVTRTSDQSNDNGARAFASFRWPSHSDFTDVTESSTTGDGIKCYGMFWDNNSEIPIHYPFRLGKSSGNHRLMIKTPNSSAGSGAVQGVEFIW